MSKKPKKVSTTLNYYKHLLILASEVSGCLSISDFAFLIGILIGITISAVEMKIYAITAAIKKCKLRIKKRRRKMTK